MGIMLMIRGIASALTVALLVVGCANLHTVNRKSSVPPLSHATTPPIIGMPNGTAIHLDAQQRLVIASARGFCAEPSPDALAAYAAALGISASDPTKRAATASGSLASVAASIGLRTQSITLMRDALYRMCEAGLNGNLTPEQMASMLDRSLDLTAVVLAIEQLTGAVAANQAALRAGGSANATAILTANDQAVEIAKKRLKEKQEALEKSKKILEPLTKKVTDTTKIYDDARSDYAKQTDGTPEKVKALEAQNSAKQAMDSAVVEELDAKRVATDAQDAVEDAEETLAAIQTTRDAALAEVQTRVDSTAALSPVATNGGPVDATSMGHVAKSVEKMVTAVLLKPGYVTSRCAELVIAGPEMPEPFVKDTWDRRLEVWKLQRDFCQESMEKASEQTQFLAK